jgi:putative selenate reductase
MAELYPLPLNQLLRRALREWKERDCIYDLPSRKWWKGDSELDLSVSFLGRDAANCVGPAAGPQSQLVQNIALAWLAGARIFELKTVQIMDELEIPRPCIDARTVGYNVEWSQELKLEQSLTEYVGAWLMLHILKELDPPGRKEVTDSDPFIFDMSVGYDLKGITTDRVTRWIENMRDAGPFIDSLRPQLDGDLKQWRDIEVPNCISSTITLSTFHGCPPEEIERIGEYVLTQLDMDLIVKLNPTLLGFEKVRDLVQGTLGYSHIHPVKEAFDEDLQWDDALPLIRRLNALAGQRGRRFGIKLTNTLVVDNKDQFFSDERMYLSGQPLHVISMNLLWKLRQEQDTVGSWLPVSFSAGIDRLNYAPAVALGLTPITTCTDLLRPGGYGRLSSYLGNLEKAMKKVSATDIPSYIQRAYGHDNEDAAAASLLNTKEYVEALSADPRYHAQKNAKSPKKIGSHLELFDCVNCDKCVPVCPNNANFVYELAPEERHYRDLIVGSDGSVSAHGAEQSFIIESEHQLACYADFCNECGNCDVFCPEDGGPYIVKPRFFGSTESFELFSTHDGYLFLESGESNQFRGRMRGVEVSMMVANGTGKFSDGVVEISVNMGTGELGDAVVVNVPAAPHVVELERLYALRAIYSGITKADAINWAIAPVIQAS